LKFVQRHNCTIRSRGLQKYLGRISRCSPSMRDLETAATKCKHIRGLVIGVPVDCALETVYYVTMFKYLEELNLTRHGVLPESDLKRILSWLAGISPFRGKRPKEADSFQAHTVGCSQDGGNTSADEGSRMSPTRSPGQLTSFGCLKVRDQHIEMISVFYNLTFLVLCDLTELCLLAPLRHLRVLYTWVRAS